MKIRGVLVLGTVVAACLLLFTVQTRGHATAVEGPDGGWWLVYHGYEHGYRTLGR